MAAKDPKAVAALIMGKMSPPSGGAMPHAEPDGDEAGGPAVDMDKDKAYDLASEDVFNALQSKDKGLFMSALKDLITLCMQSEDAGEDQGGEGY